MLLNIRSDFRIWDLLTLFDPKIGDTERRAIRE